MKTFLLLFVVSLSCNAVTPAKKAEPVKKTATKSAEVKPVHPALKEEDCDDKAKKKVEIKPETISLSGNTGCTLPE